MRFSLEPARIRSRLGQWTAGLHRITLRWLWRLLLAAGSLLLLLGLAWQFVVIPRIDQYRPWLAARISAQAGVQFSAQRLVAGWDGLRPELLVQGVVLRGAQGQPLLDFDEMRGSLAWWRLPLGEVQFSRISLNGPDLLLLRDARRRWLIGGSALDSGDASADQGRVLRWLLDQGGLAIHDGRVRVIDQTQSPARELVLSHVDFRTSRILAFRDVELGMNLPAGMGGRATLSGSLQGSDPELLADWSGRLRLQIPDTDLALVGEWLSLFRSREHLRSGRGHLQVGFDFSAAQLDALDARLALRDVQFRLDEQALNLPVFDGELAWRRGSKGDKLTLDARQLRTDSGALCENCSLAYQRNGQRHALQARGWHLAGLPALLPLLAREQQLALAGVQLDGRIAEAELGWSGDWRAARDWQGQLEFSGLGLRWPGVLPELSGLSGELELDETHGKARLSSDGLRLNYPEQFVEPLQLTTLRSRLEWRREDKGWRLAFPALQLASTDLAMSLNGQYRWPGQGLGSMALDGEISRLAANRAYAWLPRAVGDETLAWLRAALKSGQARNGRVRWHGELATFPYGPKLPGEFRISADAAEVTLAYAPGWPAIQNIHGRLLFAGPGMRIEADQARLLGVGLRGVVAEVPDLGVDAPVLDVQGDAAGPIGEYLRFLGTTPLKEEAELVPDGLRAQGEGRLQLHLQLPLYAPETSRVSGRFDFAASQLEVGEQLPALLQAQGRLLFTDEQFRLERAEAQLLGGKLALSGASDGKGGMQFALHGEAQMQAVLQHYQLPALMSGPLRYQGSLLTRDGQFDLQLQSPLRGVQIDLPAPLAKAPGSNLPLQLRVSGNERGDTFNLGLRQLLQLEVKKPVGMPLQAAIALGSMPIPATKPGLYLGGGWPELQLEDWLAWAQQQGAGATGGKAAAPIAIQGADLAFGRLSGWGQQLNDVRLGFADLGQGWLLKLGSKALSGQLISGGPGRPLQARLERLALPLAPPLRASLANGNAAQPARPPAGSTALQRWSQLELQIAQFSYKGLALGQLAVTAKPLAMGWQVEELLLSNPDGEFRMSGQWLPHERQPHSSGKFSLQTPDLGKLLTRLGYPNSMYRAPGKFSGELSWQGEAAIPDFPSLQGKLRLDMEAGRFAKVDGGNALRLLSILSLQSLSRRVRLDFNDVVNEGMEFDRISGDAQIDRGIARTGNLLIDSPAADIRFNGEANLVAATQNLRVKITPKIGDAVALAATAVNPLAGLATFALGKALNDPFGQLATMEYSISGSMADPQIRRIERLSLPGVRSASETAGK
ncbi:YhdP family protein [Chitinilyticum litopenaei]|uniref:YhdP family protein n=1 Tax=Chitinilyticum litopenaei TaxID=1121276 RepID=UPI00041D5B48|nr:YhdP family protein [Chitinilyticum litopenaei]